MNHPDLAFAFRYVQIAPQHGNEWPSHNVADPPRPPDEWMRLGSLSPWYRCHLRGDMNNRVRELSRNVEVHPRRATSLVWCQHIQNYYLKPNDCTDLGTQTQGEQDHLQDWQMLHFRHLTERPQWPGIGMYEVLEHGLQTQLDFNCPRNFDEYLPKNCFREDGSNADDACHLFGDLSLLLALHAMCPKDSGKIVDQIRMSFFHGGRPRFISTSEHGLWNPIDRYVWPGRALVMQTGIIVDPGATEANIRYQERLLKNWEIGNQGSMVSSRHPSNADRSALGFRA